MAGRRIEKALNAAFVRSVREPGKYFDGHGLFLRVRSERRALLGPAHRDPRQADRARAGQPVSREPGQAGRKRRLPTASWPAGGGDPLQAKREAAR
jgi:hypothetical protein